MFSACFPLGKSIQECPTPGDPNFPAKGFQYGNHRITEEHRRRYGEPELLTELHGYRNGTPYGPRMWDDAPETKAEADAWTNDRVEQSRDLQQEAREYYGKTDVTRNAFAAFSLTQLERAHTQNREPSRAASSSRSSSSARPSTPAPITR